MEADFSGYATKAGIRCSDGRTITVDAFKHQDKIEVPLVWQHQHDSPFNILGKAILEHRDASHPDGAGIYCYGYFNNTDAGQTTKELVHNKDIKALSIYANGLLEKSKEVLHGAIREVSVVLSGANPGALIDNIRLAHSDTGDVETLEDQAIIYSGLEIEHIGASDNDGAVSHAEDGSGDNGPTMQDIYDAMSDDEKETVRFMIGAALEQAGVGAADDSGVTHSDLDGNGDDGEDTGSTEGDGTDGDTVEGDETDTTEGDTGADGNDNTDEGDLAHKEGSDDMTRNAFEHNGTDGGGTMTATAIDTSKRISHADLKKIVDAAKRPNGSFREGVLAHAAEYGIDNIELLFPDAQLIEQTPQFISRRMEWVSTVLNGTKHSPLAAVKTMMADITKDEARAKGYIKGNRKEEEVFELLGRSVRPGTIYKKQKLDRDDLLDITDINVVSWLKAEMKLMIEEELARAILVGDGRAANHPDKVKDPQGAIDGIGIRSIFHDDDLYAIKVEMESNTDSRQAVKKLVRAMDEYRGSGNATMFIGRAALTDIMLEDDRFGRPLYANRGELADKIGVGKIETVDIFSEYDGLYCIIVSLADYTVGSNRGGELTSFEDFDIDFNQYKYLQETRLSGGLTRPFSAVVVTRAAGTLRTATQPAYDPADHEITIPTVTGVEYTIDGDVVTGTVVITEATEVRANATAGNYLAAGSTRSWYYQY